MATQAQIDASIADLVKMGVLPGANAGAGAPPATGMPQLSRDLAPPEPPAPPPPPLPSISPDATAAIRANVDAATARPPLSGIPPMAPPAPPTAPTALSKGTVDAIRANANDAAIPPPPGAPTTHVAPHLAGTSLMQTTPADMAAVHSFAFPPPQQPQQPTVSAPAGPTFVRAHFDDSRVPYRKETIASIHKAEGDELAAVDAMARAKMDESTITANELQGQAELAKQQIAQRQAHEAARQAQIDASQTKLQSAIDAASGDRINPSQWWDSRSLFEKAMASIAVGIAGGFGGKGADVVNQQIAENINAQKSNAELHQRGITNRANALTSLRDQFGDERQAEVALDMAQREAAIAHMNALVAEKKSPELRAQADQIIAQLKETQLDKKREFDRLAFVQAHVIGGAGGIAPTNNELFVPALGGNARTKEEAQKLRERSGAILQLQSNLRRAAALREELGAAGLVKDKFWSDPRAQEMRSIIEESKPMFSQAFGQGAAGDAEAARYEKAMGSLLDWTGDPSGNARRSADRLGENIKLLAKTSGVVNAEEGFRIDPKTGQLQNAQRLTGERAATPLMGRGGMPSGFVPDGGS